MKGKLHYDQACVRVREREKMRASSGMGKMDASDAEMVNNERGK